MRFSSFGAASFGQPEKAERMDRSARTNAGADAGASRNPDAPFTYSGSFPSRVSSERSVSTEVEGISTKLGGRLWPNIELKGPYRRHAEPVQGWNQGLFKIALGQRKLRPVR